MHVVIDCDPGVDDALAIVLALSRINLNVRVEAITVVDGNTSLSNGLLNTASTLKHCGRSDIPVYGGAAKPLIGFDKIPFVPHNHIHGEKGAGTYVPTASDFDEMKLVPQKSAAEALVELARKYSGTLNVIALGPLTNIALAILLDQEFPRHLASLYIMGGDYGTVWKRLGAEFNFFKDAEAANLVMREAVGHCPVVLIPFDACINSSMNSQWDWFDSIVSDNTDFGRWIHKMLVPFRHHVKQFTCCDALAVAAFVLPGAIESADEFEPSSGVQLDYLQDPVKTESCPGGQRGCVILGKKIEKEQPSSENNNGDDKGADGTDTQVVKATHHRFNLKIVTKINEHVFKTSFAEAVAYFSQRNLPHYGY